MPRSTYFVQECPTCGRNLQVRVEYLGKKVVCQHCGSQLQACEPSSADYPPMESSLSMLDRAEELLLQSAGAIAGTSSGVAEKPR